MKNGFSKLTSRALPVDGKLIRVAQAVGTCGFTTKGPATVAYVNRIAVFGFESVLSTPEAPKYLCVVVGLGYFAGASLDEVLTEGIRKVACAVNAASRLSISQVQTLALTPDPEPEVALESEQAERQAA